MLAVLLFMFLAFAAAMRGLIAYVVEMHPAAAVRAGGRGPGLSLAARPTGRPSIDDHGPELVNRFFEIVTVQKVSATLLLDGMAIVLQTVVGMLVLAFYHPFLLGFDLVLLLLIAFVIFGLGRGAVQTAIKESRAKYAVGAWLQELARHPTAFKLHAGSQFALDRADQLAVD